MFELRPYRNNNHMTTYDPVRDMGGAGSARSSATATFHGDVGTLSTSTAHWITS